MYVVWLNTGENLKAIGDRPEADDDKVPDFDNVLDVVVPLNLPSVGVIIP